MSAPFNIPKQLHNSGMITTVDPGDAKTIYVNRIPEVIPLVSAAAETRTLARPTRQGCILTLFVKTYVGNITLTVTGGYDTAGDTTYVFSAAAQWATFISLYDGTNHYWVLLSDYVIGGLNLTDLTATAAEINRNNTASSREVLAGATLTVTQVLHDGKTIAMPAVCAVTLPAATGSGSRFKFYQKVAATAVTLTATAADMYGVAWALSDNSAAVLGYVAAGSTIITFDGSTKGGVKGAIVEIEDVATSLLLVRVMSAASGSEATPFS